MTSRVRTLERHMRDSWIDTTAKKYCWKTWQRTCQPKNSQRLRQAAYGTRTVKYFAREENTESKQKEASYWFYC